jgi:tetratricopeptide (TPR) repeat protein
LHASFNQALNRYQKAEMAYAWCLDWARRGRKNAEVAGTLNNLALLDRSQNRMEEAQKELHEALQIRRELAQENPDAYLPGVAQTLLNLGVLNYGEHRTEQARQEYEEALKTRRELAEKDPDANLPDAAQTLNNLGVLDSGEYRTKEALQEYEEGAEDSPRAGPEKPAGLSAWRGADTLEPGSA